MYDPGQKQMGCAPDREFRARAQVYLLLSAHLAEPPCKDVLSRTSNLTGDDTALGSAINALAATCREAEFERLECEFHRMFTGVGRNELLPYASFYLTGFTYERSLADLRDVMRRLQVKRAAANSEPEDHIASLFELMAGLIEGRFSARASDVSHLFFTFIQPWASLFFDDLAQSAEEPFFRTLADVGRRFLEVEEKFLTLPN